MAKKDFNFGKDKKGEKEQGKLKKNEPPTPADEIARIVNDNEEQVSPQTQVSQEDSPGRGRPKKRNKDDYRKTSFDIHKDLYEAMEVHLFKNRKTIKDMRTYILGFIKADLGWKDPEDE